MEKQIILYGAGSFGRRALAHYGRDKVYCFADSNENLAGTYIEEVPVISLDKLKTIYRDYQIVISADLTAAFSIAALLEEIGIYDYIFFLNTVDFDKNSKPPAITVQNPNASENGKKRVLMIAFFYPPLSGSGVFRSLKFSKYLAPCGWQPTVISTDRAQPGAFYWDESLVKEIPDDVTVIRIPDLIGTLRDTRPLDRKEELLAFLGEVLRDSREGYAYFSSFLESKRGIAELMTFPCAALSWARDVTRYIETNLDISKFQAVYTTSFPHSAHLVGYSLKKKYGIPWVSDYRDPWTFNAYFEPDMSRPRDRMLFELEKLLLRYADRNLVTMEEYIGVYRDYFQLPEGKVECITNGYDEEDFAGISRGTEWTEKFTINYSGVMYTKNRSIVPVLQAMKELAEEGKVDLDRLLFRIVGTSDVDVEQLAAKYGMSSVLTCTGYLSHSEALKANENSNLLLLLLGDEERVKMTYPGKIFEYLRSGRPVLALAPRESAVGALLRKTGGGEAYLSTQRAEIKAMILREYQRWDRGETSEALHSPLVENYERRKLTRQLAALLDRVSK